MTQFNREETSDGAGADHAPAPGAEASDDGIELNVADVNQEVSPEAASAQATSPQGEQVADEVAAGDLEEGPDWEAVAHERTADLQRLQAEYVNYKKRVDRDRSLSRIAGVESVIHDLMPVLDSIARAKEHGEIGEGVAMIAGELEKLAAKHGLVAFGSVGEPFDPTRHDALMSVPMDEPVEVSTISQVMEPGYTLNDRVIRPARVGVANPQ